MCVCVDKEEYESIRKYPSFHRHPHPPFLALSLSLSLCLSLCLPVCLTPSVVLLSARIFTLSKSFILYTFHLEYHHHRRTMVNMGACYSVLSVTIAHVHVVKLADLLKIL